MAEEKQSIIVKCDDCKEEQTIHAHQKDIDAWKNGELIQKALPYLNKYQREILISKMCDKCWIKLFGTEEE